MSTVDHDVARNLKQSNKNARCDNIDFDRDYYADDTLTHHSHHQSGQTFITRSEKVSPQYGLRLNRDECSYIAMNGTSVVNFMTGLDSKESMRPIIWDIKERKKMDIKHDVNARCNKP